MTEMTTDRLVGDYLRDLDRAAADLPRARRTELVAEIRGHIESALNQQDPADEAAVRNVLERLGPPEEIADSARSDEPSPPRHVGGLEIGALIALVIPFLGWFVGAVLVLVSRAWSQRDKLIGVLLLFLPAVVLSLGLALAGPSGTEERVPPGDDRSVGVQEEGPPEGLGPLEILFFVNGVPSALFLAWRLRPDRRGHASRH